MSPFLYISTTKIELTVDEHNLFLLIAYGNNNTCSLVEALQQLGVSRDLSVNRVSRVYSSEDILRLRPLLDSKLLVPLNAKLKKLNLRVETQESIIHCLHNETPCKVVVFGSQVDDFDLKIILNRAAEMRSSRAKKLLSNIEYFTTPMHSSFVGEIILNADNGIISKSISIANKALVEHGLNIYQPSRGYYLLKKLSKEQNK